MLTEEERKQRDRDYSRRRREQDPVTVKASEMAYYYRNAAKLNADRCGWDKTHPEQVIARFRRYRAADPEKYAQRSLAWGRMHPEDCKRRNALYQKTHPEERKIRNEKRRALTYTNTPFDQILTFAEWLAILAQANGHCSYCGREAKLTLDHVIPLSKGGKHSKDNVVPACLHCNCSKGNRTLEEWNAKRLVQVSN